MLKKRLLNFIMFDSILLLCKSHLAFCRYLTVGLSAFLGNPFGFHRQSAFILTTDRPSLTKGKAKVGTKLAGKF